MKERANPRETLPETGVAWFIKKKDVFILEDQFKITHNWYLFRMIHYLRADAKSGRIMGQLKG